MKGGYRCAFKNCSSRSSKKEPGKSFFGFPKDQERCKLWVQACGRDDLLDKDPLALNKSYRICSLHFTDAMFLNDLKNRLQPQAIPKSISQLAIHLPLTSSRKRPREQSPSTSVQLLSEELASLPFTSKSVQVEPAASTSTSELYMTTVEPTAVASSKIFISDKCDDSISLTDSQNKVKLKF